MNYTYIVSVIIPVYNQEKYLSKSIPSVLQQTYTNLEIIIVNDGSTDESKSIIEEYAQSDHRIKIINQKNGGLVSATIAGIKSATGQYIAFLDPDDYWGCDFISNFLKGATYDEDVIAAGFYYDYESKLEPFPLQKDEIYENEELQFVKEHFIKPVSGNAISNVVFISRWNKLYKTECVKQILNEFSNCTSISLGEDSIFTYLILKYANKVRTMQAVNSYYYNCCNTSSMTKDKDVLHYLNKCEESFYIFANLLQNDSHDLQPILTLEFHLLEQFLNKQENSIEAYQTAYHQIHKFAFFHDMIACAKNGAGKRKKLQLHLWKCMTNGKLYLFVMHTMLYVYKSLKLLQLYLLQILRVGGKQSPVRTFYNCLFLRRRYVAFSQKEKLLPVIEQRLISILNTMQLPLVAFEDSTIEKNIFVLWWEGFDLAPEIVKCCFASLKKHYSDCNIIPITKDNYEKYSNIHPEILKNFKKGKISIQTFSDILRFNLLKENGGMWVDATILFTCRIDLFEQLKNQSFSSLEFATSKDFLSYKGEHCSWSGYFIASRKNGEFVTIMDKLFTNYYLQYHTFSLYFFIDIAFMVCKLRHIDHDVLNKTLFINGDMFILLGILNQEKDERIFPYINRIPQKIAWNIDVEKDKKNTYYQHFISPYIEGLNNE